MRKEQVEAKTLDVIARVKARQPHEDSFTELKAEFPDPKDAARKIAAHANSAHRQPILWIIGLCQKRGIVPFADVDLAQWWPSVRSEFDGVAPDVERLNVPHADGCVTALYFQTDRAPYVIKNPARGAPGAGPVLWEVPFREGESTRSAGRADLLRILAPAAMLPDIEVLGAKLTVTGAKLTNVWEFRMKMYVVANDAHPVTLPTHAASARLEIPAGNVVQQFIYCGFYPQGQTDPIKGWQSRSNTATFSSDEATITGAGAVIFWAAYSTSFDVIPGAEVVTVHASIRAARTYVPMVFQNHLQRIKLYDRKACWVAGEPITDDGPFALQPKES